MLKPSLQLRIGQQLTMTPQLQQAIRLLQLPVMDLQAEIQDAIENNLMLEVEEPTALDEAQESLPQTETPGATAEELVPPGLGVDPLPLDLPLVSPVDAIRGRRCPCTFQSSGGVPCANSPGS